MFIRNPDDPFVEVIPETPEIEGNSIEDDLFKDASKPAERKSSITPVALAARESPDFGTVTGFSASNTVNTKPMAAGGKLSKFGAVKVVKTVNFDEIEAKSKQEREEADRRGLGNKGITAPLAMSSPKASPISPTVSATVSNKFSLTPHSAKPAAIPSPVPVPAINKEQQEAMDRLGMGMRKMNINQSVSSSSNATAASAKIKHQQGISSEQFSSKNSATEDSFVNDRLRDIDTSKGISSDAFFGRSNVNNSSHTSVEDDDEFYKAAYSTSPTNSYANLTNSAKDFASKIAEKASTIDIKGVKKSISTAGSRLSAYLQDLQNK